MQLQLKLQRFSGKFVSHWVKSLPIVLLGREGIEQSISIIVIGPTDEVQVLRLYTYSVLKECLFLKQYMYLIWVVICEDNTLWCWILICMTPYVA